MDASRVPHAPGAGRHRPGARGPVGPRGHGGRGESAFAGARPLTEDRTPAEQLRRSLVRNVVLYTLTSLDGAVDDPRRYFPETDATVPGAPVFDSVAIELEAQLIREQDAVLLGRGMYDEWSRYWPTSDEQPFADFINTVKKYVVTSRPLETTWGDTEVVNGPLDEFLGSLK